MSACVSACQKICVTVNRQPSKKTKKWPGSGQSPSTLGTGCSARCECPYVYCKTTLSKIQHTHTHTHTQNSKRLTLVSRTKTPQTLTSCGQCIICRIQAYLYQVIAFTTASKWKFGKKTCGAARLRTSAVAKPIIAVMRDGSLPRFFVFVQQNCDKFVPVEFHPQGVQLMVGDLPQFWRHWMFLWAFFEWMPREINKSGVTELPFSLYWCWNSRRCSGSCRGL